MASAADDFTPVRFSTRALPERDRLPTWREEFRRRVVRVDIEPLSESPFHAEATLRALPGLRMVTCAGSAVRLERTAALAADGDQSVTLFVNLGRKTAISSRGRDAVLGKGDAILISRDPSVVISSDRYLALVVPHDALASRVDNLDHAIMRPIRRGADTLKLLLSYVRELNDKCGAGTPQLQRAVAAHIHDLVAMTPGPGRDAREEDGLSAVAAARLSAARARIARSFDEPGLTVGDVAHGLGVSPRYLQRLMEASGTSFTARVSELRLQKAMALLTDAAGLKGRISDVALQVGFSDISHFNRLFRSRFGNTPRSVRAASSAGCAAAAGP